MSELDIGFAKEKRWFRYRSAAIIIENDCVLLAGNEIDDYFYSVGGGVHHNETSEEAVKREVLEETGVNYEIDRLAFIHENFFIGDGSIKGYKCHELTFYYIMKSRGTQQLRSNSYTQGVEENMYWIPIDSISEYKVYPTFFADKLRNIKKQIEHIVTIEYDNSERS